MQEPGNLLYDDVEVVTEFSYIGDRLIFSQT